jgi:uncharacterized Zn-finger protein
MENCEKAFREKGNLLTHMRIHSGQRVYKCEYGDCEMSFPNSGLQLDHAKDHQGSKDYQCEQCMDKFTKQSALKAHFQSHAGDKTIACKRCEI